jgi:hypothetical protein
MRSHREIISDGFRAGYYGHPKNVPQAVGLVLGSSLGLAAYVALWRRAGLKGVLGFFIFGRLIAAALWVAGIRPRRSPTSQQRAFTAVAVLLCRLGIHCRCGKVRRG